MSNNQDNGNAAEMREALMSLRDAARDFCHQILYSKHNEIMDKYTCEKQGFPAVLALRDAIQKANAALSTTARQCDVGTPDEQLSRWKVYCNEGKARCLVHGKWRFINCTACFADWAQTPYAAQEGGAI